MVVKYQEEMQYLMLFTSLVNLNVAWVLKYNFPWAMDEVISKYGLWNTYKIILDICWLEHIQSSSDDPLWGCIHGKWNADQAFVPWHL